MAERREDLAEVVLQEDHPVRRYRDFDQMAIRVVARYDAAPMLPEAIVVLRGITV